MLTWQSFQTLAEILSEREMIGHLMENILDEATRPWGVKVERVEIKVIFSEWRPERFGEFISQSPHNLSIASQGTWALPRTTTHTLSLYHYITIH